MLPTWMNMVVQLAIHLNVLAFSRQIISFLCLAGIGGNAKSALLASFPFYSSRLFLYIPFSSPLIPPLVLPRGPRSHVEPSFAVSWLLTWFTRVYTSADATSRLIDFFLSTDPVYMPVYYAAALVAGRADDLVALQPDFAEVFVFLTELPRDDEVEDMVAAAWSLYQRFPVKRLRDTLVDRKFAQLVL